MWCKNNGGADQKAGIRAGSACHSGRVEMSHVLQAMGEVPEEWAAGTIHFTTGRMTTRDEIDRVVEVTAAAVKRLRG